MLIRSCGLTPPPVTFVLAIESGPLEPASVLYLKSLRRFGGRFAECPVLAIQPRVGPAIARETQRQLADLGARYIRRPQRGPHSWFVFMSKPYAYRIAEQEAQTPLIAFTDHDVLVAGEPTDLHLPDDMDFAACPSDKNIGSSGPGDEHDALWLSLLETLRIDPEAYPWVTEFRGGERIRLYINSGVFVTRREAGFGQAWLDTLTEMIRSNIAHHRIGIAPFEQMAVGPAIHRLGLRWKTLPLAYNFNFQRDHTDHERADFPDARLIHYHRTLQKHWGWSVEVLRRSHPELGAWLAEQTPLDEGPHSPLIRLRRGLLARVRRHRMERHLAQAKRV